MNNEDKNIASKPYRFFDFYRFEDKNIFFGRTREIEILLADITTTRLVVLFAKTGTGKTSLINAGVRPKLEELDYSTLYVRVKQDPTESIRRALIENKWLSEEPAECFLAKQLEDVAKKLNRPIVLFIDQFEEFFIYTLKENYDKAKNFIFNVAEVYRNRESGVHFVFSLREEFFVEMDIFRDEIPSIFHYESNLRLRWFDKKQAKEAIVGPLQQFGVKIEESLVEQLINDLTDDYMIEPARLQIVCDSIWRIKSKRRISLSKYKKRFVNVEKLLDCRLEEDIENNLNNEEIELFEKLLPELSTKQGTKYIREIDELNKTLKIENNLLKDLVNKLEKIGLIKESLRFEGYYIEWISDYLAERTDYLRRRVRYLSLNRLLKSAIEKAQETKKEIGKNKASQELVIFSNEQLERLYFSKSDFKKISKDLDLLVELNIEEAAYLLTSALEHGNEKEKDFDGRTYMIKWFDKATLSGLKIWDILEKKIADETSRPIQAINAIQLLADLESKKAMAILESALQKRIYPEFIIHAIFERDTDENFKILKQASGQNELIRFVLREIREKNNIDCRTISTVKILENILENKKYSAEAYEILKLFLQKEPAEVAIKSKTVLEKWKKGLQKIEKIKYVPSKVDMQRKYQTVWNDEVWETIILKIKQNYCTPFFGVGASYPTLTLNREISEELAKKYEYPLVDKYNLLHVSQYVANETDTKSLKMEVQTLLLKKMKEYNSSNELYKIFAQLPFPVYITTNYDNYLFQAINTSGKEPKFEYSRWNSFISDLEKYIDGSFEPTIANPLVYHLYGMLDIPQSIVLTEDDYIEFLLLLSKDLFSMIPHRIIRSLSATTHLFIGYDLEDITFRNLYKSITSSLDNALRQENIFIQERSKEKYNKQIEEELNNIKGVAKYLKIKESFIRNIESYIEQLINIIKYEVLENENKTEFIEKSIELEELIIKLSISNFDKDYLINLINRAQEQISKITVEDEDRNIKILEFLEKYYFNYFKISVYWGDTREFVKELYKRWQNQKKD